MAILDAGRRSQLIKQLKSHPGTLVFLSLGLIIAIFNWRILAVGSRDQLFLYGDNLLVLNNLSYLFQHFHLSNIFGTFIGQNGMMGSYPMADTQSALWYPPILALFLGCKLLRMGETGLYYGLVAVQLLHLVTGAYFIFKIARRIFDCSLRAAYLGAVVYLGLGWNAGWLGASGTILYMVGVTPIVFYALFRYLQTKRRHQFMWYIAALALLLYAGGIVNYFFYIWLNGLLIFLAAASGKLNGFHAQLDRSRFWPEARQLFVIAPLWASALYAIQLISVYIVSADVSHSAGGYDYIGFFASRLGDFAGFFFPRFGLVGFGASSNPHLLNQFSGANIMYVGIIPLILLAIGLFCLKDKLVFLFSGLAFLNLLLALGAMTWLYDLTYFFPGNSMFRGHYKYLALVGFYLSLVVPLVYDRLSAGDFNRLWLKRLAKGFLLMGLIFFFGTLAGAIAVFAYSQHDPKNYLPALSSLVSYGWRTVLMLGLSLAATVFLVRRRPLAFAAVLMILLVDTSVNYKYAYLSTTKLSDLFSRRVFSCCQGKTVINNIPKQSQAYLIPEVIGIDPVFYYQAIPNKYLAEYSGRLLDRIGNPSANLLRGGGINGVITAARVTDDRFLLKNQVQITASNYQQLYVYNASGEIHNDWGSDSALIGTQLKYYELPDVKSQFFTQDYQALAKPSAVLHLMEVGPFQPNSAVILRVEPVKRLAAASEMHNQVKSEVDQPTYKRSLVANPDGGLFFANVPYSRIWKARVNGQERPVYRTNFAFSGVEVPSGSFDNKVELFIDTRPLKLGALVSLASLSLWVWSFRKVRNEDRG